MLLLIFVLFCFFNYPHPQLSLERDHTADTHPVCLSLCSGTGRGKTSGQAASHRGEPGEEEERGDGEDPAEPARADGYRVGTDPHRN